MSTHSEINGTAEGVVRYQDIIEDGGHAWVLAHDAADWFYECLKCGDRVHILSIEKMNRAFKHNYAYMPLSHCAPWNQAKPQRVVQPNGEIAEESREPYPPCPKADVPLPSVQFVAFGPVVAVPREDD